VQVFSENPAKLFGLYPKKGSLSPGSDADLVVWDPSRVHVVDGQHGNTDHSAFDGFRLLGMPDLTMSRGHVVIENDEVVGTKGRGEFLAGDPNTASYARGGHQISRP
jgi:dihydropyrimidinase